MTGKDLIDWINESKSENAEVIVYASDGMLKGADTFEVANVTDALGKKHIAIVIR